MTETKTQWAIRPVGKPADTLSVGGWTREDAERAAVYNSQRWGPHEVVCRQVTEWEVPA